MRKSCSFSVARNGAFKSAGGGTLPFWRAPDNWKSLKTRHCDGTGFGLANYLDVPFLAPGGTYPRPQLVPHELGPFLWQVKEAALAGLVGTRLGIPAES